MDSEGDGTPTVTMPPVPLKTTSLLSNITILIEKDLIIKQCLDISASFYEMMQLLIHSLTQAAPRQHLRASCVDGRTDRRRTGFSCL